MKQQPIERKEYLKMCQLVSMQPETVIGRDLKSIKELDLIVYSDGIPYYPIEYIMWFDKGETKHSAVLHDLKSNTIVRTPLSNVYLKKEG